jgi:hypothetical protein
MRYSNLTPGAALRKLAEASSEMDVRVAQRDESDGARRTSASNEVTNPNLKKSTSPLCSVAVIARCPAQIFEVVLGYRT